MPDWADLSDDLARAGRLQFFDLLAVVCLLGAATVGVSVAVGWDQPVREAAQIETRRAADQAAAAQKAWEAVNTSLAPGVDLSSATRAQWLQAQGVLQAAGAPEIEALRTLNDHAAALEGMAAWVKTLSTVIEASNAPQAQALAPAVAAWSAQVSGLVPLTWDRLEKSKAPWDTVWSALSAPESAASEAAPPTKGKGKAAKGPARDAQQAAWEELKLRWVSVARYWNTTYDKLLSSRQRLLAAPAFAPSAAPVTASPTAPVPGLAAWQSKLAYPGPILQGLALCAALWMLGVAAVITTWAVRRRQTAVVGDALMERLRQAQAGTRQSRAQLAVLHERLEAQLRDWRQLQDRVLALARVVPAAAPGVPESAACRRFEPVQAQVQDEVQALRQQVLNLHLQTSQGLDGENLLYELEQVAQALDRLERTAQTLGDALRLCREQGGDALQEAWAEQPVHWHGDWQDIEDDWTLIRQRLRVLIRAARAAAEGQPWEVPESAQEADISIHR